MMDFISVQIFEEDDIMTPMNNADYLIRLQHADELDAMKAAKKASGLTYEALAEKIGVENRYYVELLNTGKIEALLLRREISRILFSEKSMDKAWIRCE